MHEYDLGQLNSNKNDFRVKQNNNYWGADSNNLFISDQHITGDRIMTEFNWAYWESDCNNLWVYSNL